VRYFARYISTSDGRVNCVKNNFPRTSRIKKHGENGKCNLIKVVIILICPIIQILNLYKNSKHKLLRKKTKFTKQLKGGKVKGQNKVFPTQFLKLKLKWIQRKIFYALYISTGSGARKMHKDTDNFLSR
jgi:hypothetical protein